MRSFLAAALALLSVSAFALGPRPIRIPVRHADPWAIKAMMEGQPIISPEISTIFLLMGQQGAGMAAATNAASNLLMDGILFVNPTDNSLWWYPKP